VRCQQRRVGDLSGEVVVEVGDWHFGGKDSVQSIPIFVKRNVQHRDRVASLCRNSLDQVDVAFDSRDQNAFFGIGQAKLVKRTDAVCIAIENIEVSHVGISVRVWVKAASFSACVAESSPG
jgi:hypothetical protein